ncbi:hypothetical protein, partial [Streptomyces sp. P17]|uniref:hypothetical protein n=1 Tax=Streptomyces sp. P17 TaxID=3074716 RepID=UPI0028F43376
MTTANTALSESAGAITADTVKVTVIRHTSSSRVAAMVSLIVLAGMITMPWWGQSGHIRWV